MNIVELTEEAFRIDGALSYILQQSGHAYRYREEQAAYALAIAKALSDHDGERGHVACMEASTGVGKSLGYLIPALLRAASGYRGVISTFTLHLQHQIVQKDAMLAQRVVKHLTGIEVSVAARKGMRNFVSASRVEQQRQIMMLDRGKHEEAITYLTDLMGYGGDLREFVSLNGPLPAGIDESDVCLTNLCSTDDKAKYQEHVDASLEADVVVVPHALLMLDALKWFSVLSGSGDQIDFVLCDEADQIPNTAEGIYSKKVTLPMLRGAANVMAKNKVNNSAFVKSIDDLEVQLEKVKGHKNSRTWDTRERSRYGFALVGDWCHTLKGELDLHLEKVQGHLEKCASKVQKIALDVDFLETVLNLQAGIRYFRDAMKTENLNNTIPAVVSTPLRENLGVACVPRYPGRLFGRYFCQLRDESPVLNTLVCTSATLEAETAKGVTFQSFRRDIGLFTDEYGHGSNGSIFRLDVSGKFEPKKFGKLRFSIAAADTPHPTHEDLEQEVFVTSEAWVEFACRHIARTIGKGRHYVLCNSFKDVKLLGERLQQMTAQPVLMQARGKKISAYLDDYRANEHAVLITASGWEGVDLPGLIDYLVITRIPFRPADPLHEAIYRDISKHLGQTKQADQYIYAEVLRAARMMLEQGIGRATRSETDDVEVVILDNRFPRPGEGITHQRTSFNSLLTAIPTRFRTGLFAPYKAGRVKLLSGDDMG